MKGLETPLAHTLDTGQISAELIFAVPPFKPTQVATSLQQRTTNTPLHIFDSRSLCHEYGLNKHILCSDTTLFAAFILQIFLFVV